MSSFSWILPPPTTTFTPSVVTALGLGSGPVLPAIRPNLSGTFSWLLVNLEGTTDMRPGEMDFLWVNGSVRAITDGVLVLDQRIRKSTAEVQGENPFAEGWGSVVTEYIGRKLLGTDTLRLVGRAVVEMFDELISLQAETQDRLALDPAELINIVDRVTVTASGTKLSISVRVITQAETVEEILITEAINVVQNS